MNLQDFLTEAGGQLDATGQLLKGYALQPVAGLGGAGRTMIDLLRGRGVGPAMEAGARTVEDIQGWGGGPMTERGAQRLGELGGLVERGTQAVGGALGNPIEKLGSIPTYGPALAASALGFMETANPAKGLKAVGTAAKGAKEAAMVKALRGGDWTPEPVRLPPPEYDFDQPRQMMVPGVDPRALQTARGRDVRRDAFVEGLRGQGDAPPLQHPGQQSLDFPKPLQYDPMVPGQAMIPGVEPLTQQQMLGAALARQPSADPHASVNAFLNAARSDPSIFTYGTMPENVPPGLEAMAEAFGRRAKEPLYVEYRDGYSDEPYKIEVPKEHGYGEVMRDRYGDYKGGDKLHEPGDYPMKDEYGDIKTYEVKGPPREDDVKVTAMKVAQGGEPVRDRYGDTEFVYKKSRGGEPVRDERGNQKYTKVENPDYEDTPEGIRLSSGKGHIDIEGYDEATPRHPAYVTATEASSGGRGTGSLMYQALLADASRSGKHIGTAGLTRDNQFRLLNNVLANVARTGVNTRDVTGTASGTRPRARGYASGPELWEALSGEADARVQGVGGDPNRLQFTGTGFTLDGKPAHYDDVKMNIEELSPQFRSGTRTLVGPKSLMQSAIYKWLERATPEEAEMAAKGWASNVGKPVFGRARPEFLGALAAGSGGAAALINALRGDDERNR